MVTVDLDKNVWLEKAINQLYIMRDDHNRLSSEVKLMHRQISDLRDELNKHRLLVAKLEKLVNETGVIV